MIIDFDIHPRNAEGAIQLASERKFEDFGNEHWRYLILSLANDANRSGEKYFTNVPKMDVIRLFGLRLSGQDDSIQAATMRFLQAELSPQARTNFTMAFNHTMGYAYDKYVLRTTDAEMADMAKFFSAMLYLSSLGYGGGEVMDLARAMRITFERRLPQEVRAWAASKFFNRDFGNSPPDSVWKRLVSEARTYPALARAALSYLIRHDPYEGVRFLDSFGTADAKPVDAVLSQLIPKLFTALRCYSNWQTWLRTEAVTLRPWTIKVLKQYTDGVEGHETLWALLPEQV